MSEFYHNWWTSATANTKALSFEYAFSLANTFRLLQQEESIKSEHIILK